MENENNVNPCILVKSIMAPSLRPVSKNTYARYKRVVNTCQDEKRLPVVFVLFELIDRRNSCPYTRRLEHGCSGRPRISPAVSIASHPVYRYIGRHTYRERFKSQVDAFFIHPPLRFVFVFPTGRSVSPPFQRFKRYRAEDR